MGLGRLLRGPQIGLLHDFRPAPWGGGNQFMRALRGELERRGYAVGAGWPGYGTRALLFNAFNFRPWRIRLAPPGCRRVHRVDGPVGTYRGTDHGIDRGIWRVNKRFADATVFQSRYSLEAHRRLGLEFADAVVIHNAVDPELFHPRGRLPWEPTRRVRLISTAWSDNPNKGGGSYRWLEQRLDWTRYEWTFVGRSAERFEKIRMLAPVPSRELGDLLRSHDAYVTASLHESCSNGLLEALACDLPALHVRSGSNAELVGDGGVGYEHLPEMLEGLERLVADLPRFRRAIRVSSLAETADRYLEVLGLPPEAASPDQR